MRRDQQLYRQEIKKLDELSFDDLCVDIDEQSFPYLRDAFRRLLAKAHLYRTKARDLKGAKQYGHAHKPIIIPH